MLILNLSADSFSGDGLNPLSLEHRIQELETKSFSFLDVGAVSTRPGSLPVDPSEEWDRLKTALPIIDSFYNYRKNAGRPINLSLDTSSPVVAVKALELIPHITLINDVYAGRKCENGITTLDVARRAQCGILLMHMQNEPRTMQIKPRYDNCLHEVTSFLRARYFEAQALGIRNIYLDPGIGFGKRYEDNLSLLTQDAFHAYSTLIEDRPVQMVIGLSRKRFIAEWMSRTLEEAKEIEPRKRDSGTKHWERQCLLEANQVNANKQVLNLYLRTHRLPEEVESKESE